MESSSKVPLAATFALVMVIAVWWLPQKWQACQKLYSNNLAQTVCFLGK